MVLGSLLLAGRELSGRPRTYKPWSWEGFIGRQLGCRVLEGQKVSLGLRTPSLKAVPNQAADLKSVGSFCPLTACICGIRVWAVLIPSSVEWWLGLSRASLLGYTTTRAFSGAQACGACEINPEAAFFPGS